MMASGTDGVGCMTNVDVDVIEVEVIDAADVEVLDESAALALFGGREVQVAERDDNALRPGFHDLRREWDKAFEAWLGDVATSPSTEKAYRVAWDDLWAFVLALDPAGDPPRVTEYWQISHRHIRAWTVDLETRPLDPRRVVTLKRRGRKRRRGYAPGTIQQRLAAISSFYSYAEFNWPVMLPNGAEISLTLVSQMTLNPVRVIKRRGGGAGENAKEQAYLSLEQLRAFLGAIPRTTTQGLRDRALFLFYVMTGARNTEARTLTWGDFRERGGRMFWYWRGKGRGRKSTKEQWKELPPEVWDAVVLYLKAAGRWGQLEEDDPIFTALTDRAGNLPHVSAEFWDPHSDPLTAREVNRLVKKYAERAGLDPDDVHVHTLRHSAAMLMDEAGADVDEIRRFLNHENLNTTQLYLHKMKGQRNVHAGKMAELLRL